MLHDALYEALWIGDRFTRAGADLLSLALTVGLIFLAGLSEGLGTQSVVLFLNQVGRRSFALSLLASGALFVISALCWAASIGLVARLAFGLPISPLALAALIRPGYLPLLFAFLAFTPYVGPVIAHLLHASSFILVTMQLEVVLALAPWQALSCTVGGWLVLQAARGLLSRPIARLGRRLWALTTRHAQQLQLEDIPAHLARLPEEGMGQVER